MKSIRWIVVALLAAALLGCAATQTAVTGQRDGNRVTYTHTETGHLVHIDVMPPLSYQKMITRKPQGNKVKGFLFSADADNVVIYRMPIADFEALTGLSIDVPEESVKTYEPKTFFDPAYCRLTRAHAATLKDDIVIAAYVNDLLDKGITCQDWADLDAIRAAQPDLVEAFDAAGDRSIVVIVK